MRRPELDGVVFHELLGFKERDGALVDDVARRCATAAASRRARVAGAARAVFDVARTVQGDSGRRRTSSACPIMSVHLGESAEEVEFLEKGSGPWRGMLETIGAVAR